MTVLVCLQYLQKATAPCSQHSADSLDTPEIISSHQTFGSQRLWTENTKFWGLKFEGMYVKDSCL